MICTTMGSGFPETACPDSDVARMHTAGAADGPGPVGPRAAGHILILAVILAAGLALRLWDLGTQSFWFDEAQTLDVALYPPGEIIQRAYRPPLYHFLLHYWAGLVPQSEFWLRLPSALFGAAVPAFIYLAVRSLYSQRAGLLAALAAALSPALLWYSQELRMYSLLALEFAILLWLLSWLLDASSGVSLSLLGALFLSEVAALYTHYFAIPFLAWMILAVTLVLWQRKTPALRGWLAVQGASAIAYIPWLWMVAAGRGGTEDYVAGGAPPVEVEFQTLGDFLRHTWQFFTTGPMELPPKGILQVGSLVIFLILAVFIIYLGIKAGRAVRGDPSARERVGDALIITLLLGPLATAALMFWLRPGVVHPRHLMMLAVPLASLCGRAGDLALTKEPRAAMGKILGGVAFLGLMGLALLGDLGCLRGAPGCVRADVRALAEHLAEITSPGDMVITPYVDHALSYYYKGPAQLRYVETRVGDEPLAGWFLPQLQGAKHAVIVRWVHSFADPRGFLPWLLRVNGRLEDEYWYSERLVSEYSLNDSLQMPRLSPVDVRIGPMRLRGAYIPEGGPADQEVPVALLWELAEPVTENYKASVRVLDPSGHLLAQRDEMILAESSYAPTSSWQPGDRAHAYYMLPLPVGTPPSTTTVTVSLYGEGPPAEVLDASGAPAGTHYLLGTYVVQPATRWPQTYPPELPMIRLEREVAPGLELIGLTLRQEAGESGGALDVILHWRANSAPLPDYRPELVLLSAQGVTLAQQAGAPVEDSYPTNLWRSGELISDERRLLIAADAPSGEATLVLKIQGQIPLTLSTVPITHLNRRFDLPEPQHPLDITLDGVARLLGYDLEAEDGRVIAGQPFALTLYWQAVGSQPPVMDYAVFTQLLSPERALIAQHDGQPAAAEWPTSRWVQGQVIEDRHVLEFRNPGYRGPAQLQVGLYDPQTLQRLTTAEGDDAVILADLEVVPPSEGD